MTQFSTAPRPRHLLAAAGLFAALASGAGASIIPVVNPTFDATFTANTTFNGNPYNAGDSIPQGSFASGTGTNVPVYIESTGTLTTSQANVPGWSSTNGRGGVVNPSEVTSGNSNVGDVAYITTLNDVNGGSISITQDLLIPFHPDTLYTLSVELLQKNVPLSPSYYVDLTAAGTRVNGTQVIVAPTALTPGSDTVTFLTGAVPPSGDLGIILHATDLSGNVTQILFDNVSLTAVPEPASVGVFVLGGLLMLPRQRKI